MEEKKLQTKVIRFLKDCGAYVVKTKPGMGTPVGCPDIIFFADDGKCGFIEVKAMKNAVFQPGQIATLEHLAKKGHFTLIVYPECWETSKKLILSNFFL